MWVKFPAHPAPLRHVRVHRSEATHTSTSSPDCAAVDSSTRHRGCFRAGPWCGCLEWWTSAEQWGLAPVPEQAPNVGCRTGAYGIPRARRRRFRSSKHLFELGNGIPQPLPRADNGPPSAERPRRVGPFDPADVSAHPCGVHAVVTSPSYGVVAPHRRCSHLPGRAGDPGERNSTWDTSRSLGLDTSRLSCPPHSTWPSPTSCPSPLDAMLGHGRPVGAEPPEWAR